MIYGKTNVQSIAMKADRSSAMVSLNTLQTNISLNIYKNGANKFGRKTGFKIKNEIEDQYQSIPKLTGILTELRCIIGQNLEILTSTGGEWSWGQAQNCVNFDFQVKFDLEGQGQSTPKNNRDLNQVVLHVWFKFGDSSWNQWQVIARTSSWLTPTRTDAGNDNTRRPKLASGKKQKYRVNKPSIRIAIKLLKRVPDSYWNTHCAVRK